MDGLSCLLHRPTGIRVDLEVMYPARNVFHNHSPLQATSGQWTEVRTDPRSGIKLLFFDLPVQKAVRVMSKSDIQKALNRTLLN